MITPVLKEIPLKEVQLHDTYNDIWIILFNRVYDITSFLHEHPGGYEVILEYAGRDASLAFLGAGHDAIPMSAIESYLIGILPQSEHLNLPFPDWNNRLKEFQN
ncbi:cytochrome b5 [Halyomorpha halys]|uniref:cytochrome b5 n=1 Tax=Halyomorpha halys TaxID=286706 RepID=UPI000D0C8342|nr:cytochrome b5-like [Halyomorpha halys]